MNLYAWILLADEEAKKAVDGGQPAWGPLPMLVLIAVLFYFMIILPGRKERQQRQALITALKKDDKIVTNAGIIGVVLSIKEGDEVVIKSDETKLRVLKSSIARVEPAKETPGKETPAENKP